MNKMTLVMSEIISNVMLSKTSRKKLKTQFLKAALINVLIAVTKAKKTMLVLICNV